MNKITLSTLFILLISIDGFSQDSGLEIRNSVISGGIGFGSILAVVTSWERNKSVLLAFLHGIFSWLYVIYFVLTRKKSERQ